MNFDGKNASWLSFEEEAPEKCPGAGLEKMFLRGLYPCRFCREDLCASDLPVAEGKECRKKA